jgi:uncharacterized membrane protein YdbT with pleckstrin-like domain
MEPEKTVYQTSPSQIVNLKIFVACFLLVAGIVVLSIVIGNPLVLVLLIVPFVFAWWKWLLVKSMKLTITNQRLIVTSGVFHRVTNETELYRVRDTSIEEPFLYRLFGVGNIVVYSTDEAEGKLLFHAFHKPHWIKDQIRNFAEVCRRNRRWGNDNVLIHEHEI